MTKSDGRTNDELRMSDDPKPHLFTRGNRIGPYEIASPIGAGGMGEVFRARDTRLNRDVAVKVLPKDFGADGDRLRRFEQEAKTLAALNHPNVLTIHDTGIHEGAPYLVSELLEGKSLREEMSGGALPVRKATEYALQIAHGLAAANGKGVIHRDLKPENIFVTKDGRVKILDFGLAKQRAPLPSGDERGRQEAATIPIDPDAIVNTTQPGMVLGTPSYMSPEQVRGEPADHRADIFAFGCVLYEMLSGTRAFRRRTPVESMNAVLNSAPPDLSTTHPNIPLALARIVDRCLEKQPDNRFQSAKDLAFALENLSDPTSVSARVLQGKAAPRWLSREGLAWATAALLLTLLALAGISLRRQPAAAQPTLRLSIAPPADCQDSDFALSPDGRYLAFTAALADKVVLMIRTLASDEIRTVPDVSRASALFWSPDSRFIGYYESAAKLKAAPVNGGRPREICSARGGGATWNQDGVIVFTEFWGGGLFRVSAGGGDVTPLTTLNTAEQEGVHLWPRFLPDDRHFLFLVRSTQPESTFIWLGSTNTAETRRRLIQADALVGWVDPDQVLFVRGGALHAQTFDAKLLTFVGSPRVVADLVAFQSEDSVAQATCSRNGILAYKEKHLPTGHLTWLDRTGQPVGTVGQPMTIHSFRLAPDERTVAVSKFDRRAGAWNLWQVDAANGTEDRLTFLRNAQRPVWSPDGSEIIYDSDEFTMFNVYRRRVDRTTPEQPIYRTAMDDKLPTDWSSDGQHLLFSQRTEKNATDIWFLSLEDPSHPQPLLQTEADEMNARFSPDGRWIAYSSNESGRPQVYLQAFPKGGSRIIVSRNGGALPVWNPNGKELFFLDPERTLLSVEIKSDDSGAMKPGAPKPLFRRPANATSRIDSYDVSRDGQRFLFALDVASPGSENIAVLLNWVGESNR